MRAPAFALALLVGMGLVMTAESARPPSPPSPFKLELAALSEYVAGFPLPVALTLANVTTGTGINDVPSWGPWDLGRAQLTFVFTNGSARPRTISLPRPTGDPMGDSYGPGQARRRILDLSLLDGLPPPGSYTLRITFTHRGASITSNDVRFALRAPSHADAAAAAQLSHGAPWSEFVAANWREVAVPELSKAARHQLALHLFVQRAVYGPERLGDQPLSWLEPLAHGLFAPEAEVYRVELLAARHDSHVASVAAAAGKGTPGVRIAVEQALAGQGELGFLRRSVGAERGDPPGRVPYAK